jgi:hypothetical protein
MVRICIEQSWITAIPFTCHIVIVKLSGILPRNSLIKSELGIKGAKVLSPKAVSFFSLLSTTAMRLQQPLAAPAAAITRNYHHPDNNIHGNFLNDL